MGRVLVAERLAGVRARLLCLSTPPRGFLGPLGRRAFGLSARCVDTPEASLITESLIFTPAARRKLYHELCPLYANRPFFYTRVVNQHRLRLRDAAPMAYLEFVDRSAVTVVCSLCPVSSFQTLPSLLSLKCSSSSACNFHQLSVRVSVCIHR